MTRIKLDTFPIQPIGKIFLPSPTSGLDFGKQLEGMKNIVLWIASVNL
jgi:hypothetical protein